MNRKIKFRGKASNMLYNGADILHHKGDWLYGDLIHQDGKCFIAPVDKRYPYGTSFLSFVVDAETVGQMIEKYKSCTLYEGDIIKFDRESFDGEPDNYAVIGRFGEVETAYDSDFDIGLIQWINNIDWELVGNRFDNPELLTDKD